MPFQKGNLYHKLRTNHKHSDETKRKIGLSNKGKTLGKPSWNKGKHLSSQHKKALSEAKYKNPVRYWKGKHHVLTGKRHWNWQGGINSTNDTIRKSLEYKLWRTAVFERDNYTCIWGGKEHGSKLNADHIKPFAYFPELRFAIDNGRTLCANCHKTTDTYGGKGHK